LKLVLIILTSFITLEGTLYSQDEIEITQKQWEMQRDSFAVKAIIMLAKIDTINIEIDSLKKYLEYSENLDCEAELYKIVGATKEQVYDYRNKFEVTEKKINDKTGTPGDAHSLYFNEVSSSKIRCLPEFSDRFLSMKKNIESWESKQIIVIVTQIEKTYTVVEGDYLRKIAEEKYGDPDLWTLIWEANKESIYNADEFLKPYKKKILNPDIIYPGQILNIPSKP